MIEHCLKDPTREQMVSHLDTYRTSEYSDLEWEFFREEAIYFFSSDWHSGQYSNLYSVLSTSQVEHFIDS